MTRVSRFRILIALFFVLNASSAFAQVPPFPLGGEYEQEGQCVCLDYDKRPCDDTPLAISALAFYYTTGNLSLGRSWDRVADPTTGESVTIAIWTYDRHVPGKPDFVVRQIDRLTYSFVNGSRPNELKVTVRNHSVEQEPFAFTITLPEPRKGGELDGPAQESIEIDSSKIMYSNFARRSDDGRGTAGPTVPFPIAGENWTLDFFLLEKKEANRLAVTKLFDRQFRRNGVGTPKTWNYGLETCALKPVP